MYQDIPLKDHGSTNLCNGLPYEVFKSYIERELLRKFQTVSLYDTPTTIYILYVNKYSGGYIGLEQKLIKIGKNSLAIYTM